MLPSSTIAFSLCWLIVDLQLIRSIHLTGTWDNAQLFTIIAKFGFQQSDPVDKDHTLGFIYGNITSTHNIIDTSRILMAIYPQHRIETLLTATNANDANCSTILDETKRLAFESRCFKAGQLDMLRWVSRECVFHSSCCLRYHATSVHYVMMSAPIRYVCCRMHNLRSKSMNHIRPNIGI